MAQKNGNAATAKKAKDPELPGISLLTVSGAYGNGTIANTALVTLEIEGLHATAMAAAKGRQGPVYAIFAAIDQLVPHRSKLVKFEVDADKEGADSTGKVRAELKAEEGGLFAGEGDDENVLVAAAFAYIDAIRQVIAFRRKRDKRLHDSDHPNGNLDDRRIAV